MFNYALWRLFPFQERLHPLVLFAFCKIEQVNSCEFEHNCFFQRRNANGL